MKRNIFISIVILVAVFFIFNQKSENNKLITETYPWQISLLSDGRTRVFGVILGESSLKEVNVILKKVPKIAVFETDGKLSLEAYYENIFLGGLLGSFMFTLNVQDRKLEKIKKKSRHVKRINNATRYALDRIETEKLTNAIVKDLIYIPTAQLDEKTIVKRFGEPAYKIKLQTKGIGWHYLYPEKGLDLIYKEEGKEVLQYVLPKKFNLLLEPLQAD